MSTARFAFLCTFIVVLVFFLSTMVAGAIVLAVLAGLLSLLKDHRRLYFDLSRKGLFTYIAYPFAVAIMIWTTLCFIPGLGRVIPSGLALPDPFPASYGLHFALGSLFLLWALKPKNPNIHPMPFTGSVFWEQLGLLQQAPRMILESLKRAAVTITQEHWLKGIGGIVLLLLSIPVGIIALTAGTLALYWFAVIWAGMSALAMIPLWLAFKIVHRRGIHKRCQGCGVEHAISGPGPSGFFKIQCRCGHRISIWKTGEDPMPSVESPNTLGWSQRPRQRGTLPLLVIGVVVTLLMVLRTFGIWDGPIRTIPWPQSKPQEEAVAAAAKAPQARGSVSPAKGWNR